jgi:hypothetical protein
MTRIESLQSDPGPRGSGPPGPLAARRDTVGGAATFTIAAAVALVATLAAMLAMSPIGPGNDQALFVYYGALLREGATLYRDIWDNKQPGIFGFYAAAGALFGEGWPGARAAYAVWLGVGAGVIAAIARRVAPGTWAWLAAPVLTVGLTLVRNDIERPAQVESLLGLPLALLVLLSVVEPASVGLRRMRWLAAGVLVGVVGSLKLVLAPVAAAIIASGLLWRMRRPGFGLGTATGAIAWTVIGAALVWGPIVAWLLLRGAGAEFAWTMLEYPRLALAHVELQPPSRLVGALRWLAVSTVLLLPAAAVCVWRAWREPDSPRAAVALAGTAWVLVGLVMIATQRFSWWDTHMDLVIWPIGLLAALGIAGRGATPGRRPVIESPGRGRWVRPAIGALAALGLVVHTARFARDWVADPDWPAPQVEQAAIATALEVRARAVTPCGTVYAIGDQAGVERVTSLRQALPTHGLWFGAFLPAQAERLPSELRSARPDLVYYDGAERRDFLRRWPTVAASIDAWLASDYLPLATDAMEGRWWQRRDATDPTPPPCPPAQRFTIPAGGA